MRPVSTAGNPSMERPSPKWDRCLTTAPAPTRQAPPTSLPSHTMAPGSITEPHLSPDGKTLYYTRDLVIWSVDLPPILERLRSKA